MKLLVDLLTVELRRFEHLLEDVALDDQKVGVILLIRVRRLIALLDGMHDQRLPITRLDPEDDAPEEIPLRGSVGGIVIREVSGQLPVAHHARHEFRHRKLRPLGNLVMWYLRTLQILLGALCQLLQVFQSAALLGRKMDIY